MNMKRQITIQLWQRSAELTDVKVATSIGPAGRYIRITEQTVANADVRSYIAATVAEHLEVQ